MAYKARAEEVLSVNLLEGVRHFWAINRSVGWGNENRKDDVMLVQYLINSVGKFKKLEEDGIFGNETHKGIKKFQKFMNETFGSTTCAPDGRISHMDGSRYVSQSDRFFTIHLLNAVYSWEKRIYYDDLRRDPNLPTHLCSVLSGSV